MGIGIYVCQCNGQVSTIIDTARLADTMRRARGVAISVDHPCLCSPSGVELIKRGISEGNIDRIILAGCSPRVHEETFKRAVQEAGLNQHLVERCNIREQCAWPHAGEPEAAARKARVLLGMSLARVRLLEALMPVKYPSVNRALVLGAGIAGLSAAADLAAAGVEVAVVEKQPYVGGRVVGFHKYFPRMCPPQCGVDFLLQKLRADPRVTFYTQAELEGIAGCPGNFQVDLVIRPRFVAPERCTACGVCADVCPVQVPNPFDFGRSARKAVYLPHAMAYPRSHVVDRAKCLPGCDSCSKICPTGAICLEQQEDRVRINVGAVLVATGWEPFEASLVEQYGYGRYPDVVTNVEFERLASPNGPTGGRMVRLSSGEPIKSIAFLQCVGSRDSEHLPYCSQICCTVTLKQIAYVREACPDASIYVFYMDMRAVGDYELMYRDAQERLGATFIRGNPSEVVEDPRSKQLVVRAEDTLSGRQVQFLADMVVLATGMKPDPGLGKILHALDLSPEGTQFAGGHVQCFPFELQRTGIYAAGSCQGPMDVATAVKSAGGAAMKAMPVLRGEIEIPPAVPVIDKTKCDKCKRCMEECPFGAWYWDDTGYPAPDLAKCRQCGICQGGCPMRAISLKNFTIKQVASMIEAVDASFPGKEQPVVLAFLCANDAYPCADLAGQKGYSYPPNVLSIRVPCAGSVNVAWVTDALTSGIDGVIICGCSADQCHFVRGSDLARTRLENMRETLQRMLIEPERVRMATLAINDPEAYVRLLQEFVTDLRRLGPSPFKVT
ncbi:MAG: hydrogenase iron-sulfur subunit [Bacillota bacterium]